MQDDCCKTEHKKILGKKKVDPFLLGIGLVTLLLLITVTYFGLKMGNAEQVSADTSVNAQIDANRYDWGAIPIDGGVVDHSFFIENTSANALKLYAVKTSCMCTTAWLKTKEQTSKRFGMHEKGGEVFEVQPGETAELVVEFDPAFHGPSGLGPISRTVTLRTNDASNPTLSFQVTANVIKN